MKIIPLLPKGHSESQHVRDHGIDTELKRQVIQTFTSSPTESVIIITIIIIIIIIIII